MKRPRPAEKTDLAAAVRTRLYLAARPPAVRKRLQQIRAIVHAAAPTAVEHFSYGVPGFRLAGQPLIWYAAFKHHIGLYPIKAELLRAHRIDVSGYETSKGTVRLPLDEPLPIALVKRLVKARAAETLARARSSSARRFVSFRGESRKA